MELSVLSMPIGTIVSYALNTTNIPDGWLLCDGREIPSRYQTFIQLLNDNYTPDLRGRTLIGAGVPSNSPQSDQTTPNFPPPPFAFIAGFTGGEYAHTLTGTEVPPHTHKLNNGVDNEDGSSHDFPTPPDATQLPDYTGSTSAGPHNTMQPYYVINYLIFAGPDPS